MMMKEVLELDIRIFSQSESHRLRSLKVIHGVHDAQTNESSDYNFKVEFAEFDLCPAH